MGDGLLLKSTKYECGCKVLVSYKNQKTLVIEPYPCQNHSKYSSGNKKEISLTNRLPVYAKRHPPTNLAVGGFDCEDKDAINDYVENLLEKSLF